MLWGVPAIADEMFCWNSDKSSNLCPNTAIASGNCRSEGPVTQHDCVIIERCRTRAQSPPLTPTPHCWACTANRTVRSIATRPSTVRRGLELSSTTEKVFVKKKRGLCYIVLAALTLVDKTQKEDSHANRAAGAPYGWCLR